MQKKSIVVAENIGYELTSTKILFQGIQVSIEEGDRIALIGRNGVGKSTLLQILASQLLPTSGSISRYGTVYYLPQISTIRQEVKADTVLNFLSSMTEEWWKIEDILAANSTRLDLSLPLASLSGGELTKLFLAIGLSQKPDLLLLDEPTNHMDIIALENLRHFLHEFEGAFVIVSHKPFFLDMVANITWELTPDRVNVYGGNFSLYREQKEIEQDVAIRSHSFAKKELKRAKISVLQEQQRADQSHGNGRKKFLGGSVDKVKAGLLKTKAEAKAGTAKKKHEAMVAKATEKVC